MQTTAILLLALGVGYSLAQPANKCSVRPEDRVDCGFYGIDRNTCEKSGYCCYDDTVDGAIVCFYGSGSDKCGIIPQERRDCGYSGIQRDECESKRSCCFDDKEPNAPHCFFGEPVGRCSVRPEDRSDCGWYGINRDDCMNRGCCYDDTIKDTRFCFHPTAV
ncbi:uncharacterized protein LOC144633315 [Oculina patagonica]